MFRDQSLDQFLAELSSRAPTPGGGSAAGLAAAMGVALVEMVAHVVGARDESEKARLDGFVAVCETTRGTFLELMGTGQQCLPAVHGCHETCKGNR